MYYYPKTYFYILGRTVMNSVLCGCSAYNEKYYLDPKYEGLPSQIRDELKIMCVSYTADVGGILTLEFEEDGTLVFRTECDEGDLLYDEIGSVLKVKQMSIEKRELLESLELYYKVKNGLAKVE